MLNKVEVVNTCSTKNSVDFLIPLDFGTCTFPSSLLNPTVPQARNAPPRAQKKKQPKKVFPLCMVNTYPIASSSKFY